MSKRLQILMPDKEMEEIQLLASRQKLSVGEWVRSTLSEARNAKSMIDPESKLRAIRSAAEYSFPTGDIDQMLAEIAQGYPTDLP